MRGFLLVLVIFQFVELPCNLCRASEPAPRETAEPRPDDQAIEELEGQTDPLTQRIKQLEREVEQLKMSQPAPSGFMFMRQVPIAPGPRFHANPQFRSANPQLMNSPGGPGTIPPLAAPAPSVAAPAPSGMESSFIPEPAFLTLSYFDIAARAAAVVDTTRLDPNALGLFLPSAIPAKGEPSFGLGERTTFQGNGSAVGFSWLANVAPAAPVDGAVRLQVLDTTSGTVNASATQAWLRWSKVTVGQTDSTFTDVTVIPETIDLGGPNARPFFYKGTTVFRYAAFEPSDRVADPSGWYGTIAAENPAVDVSLPPGFQSFSRYPDFIGTLKYQEGIWTHKRCNNTQIYEEYWHLQLGGVVRDLGMESSNKFSSTFREEATGWGLQLTGRYSIFRDDDDTLTDFIMFSGSGGEGLARYYNDLNLVNPVNDLFFNPKTHVLTALPVAGGFIAYQHAWTPELRSTATYSHLELWSQAAPGVPAPYRRGDYASINLMYHLTVCDTVKPPPDKGNTEHALFAGVEYLFGEKEVLGGARGTDHRIMFMISGTK